jgi:PAS domain S-box-containing protein
MKINTAMALLASGLALFILAERLSVHLDHAGQALGVAVALLGVLTLSEYLLGWDLAIDQWLMKDHTDAYNVFRGRMSPFSAVAFVAIGGALASIPYVALKTVTQVGAAFTLVVASVSLLGYLWSAGELVTDTVLPPVAVNTACCFLLLGLGILISPRRSDLGLAGQIGSLRAVEIQTLTGFGIAFLLLVIGGGYTYRTNVEFASSTAWISHTQEVRSLLAATDGALAGAELAERDYLLTADPAHLEDCRRLVKELQEQLAHLRRLTSDNPLQRHNLAVLEDLIAKRINDIDAGVAAFAASGLPAARTILARTRDVSVTRLVPQALEQMDALEAGYLEERRSSTARARHTTLVSLLLTLLVAATAFVALYLRIHREMQARRRAESHLLETNRFLDSLIDNLPVMVVLKDAESFRFVRHNRTCERLLGVTREELVGRTAAELFSEEEADFITAKDREALAGSGLVELEQSILTRHLGVRTFHTMKLPVGNESGRPQFLLAIAVDITDRKAAERAILDLNTALGANAEQLKATNKELESFSYSVSHDLRAPLRAIDGFAMMIEEDCAARLDDEGRRYLSVIRENSKRMGILIDDLLTFSRLGRLPVATREVDMDELVREVVAEMPEPQGAARPQIEISALPPVRADPGLLRQVWANLLANAVKYSSKTARPRIEVSGRRDGAENCYSVRDNGVGFNMAYADKLFGVFQRLHRADEFSGTGVGLAIVHRVVTRHGGRVWAEGEVDRGAVFSFALPAGGCGGNV